ncbi:MAG: hypothetical protein ABSE61_26495 [Bradyrhizobium sp.]
MDAVAVAGHRERFVKFCSYLDARADIVEQLANLVCGKGLAASGNGVALQPNGTAEPGEIVGDPMIGLGQSDISMIDQDCHFFLSPQNGMVRFETAEIKKTIISSMHYWHIGWLFGSICQNQKVRSMSINSKELILGLLR